MKNLSLIMISINLLTPLAWAQNNYSLPQNSNTNMEQPINNQTNPYYNYYTPNNPQTLNPDYAYNKALQSSQGYAPKATTNQQSNIPPNRQTNQQIKQPQNNSNTDIKALRKDFSKGLQSNQSEGIKVPALLLSSTPNLEGYHIKKYIGLVQGVMVREPNMYQNIQTSLTTFMNAGGGSLNSYIQMCGETRQDALDSMVIRAAKLGANAILSIRYNDSSVSVSKDQFANEVACYGTAVIVEKIK